MLIEFTGGDVRRIIKPGEYKGYKILKEMFGQHPAGIFEFLISETESLLRLEVFEDSPAIIGSLPGESMPFRISTSKGRNGVFQVVMFYPDGGVTVQSQGSYFTFADINNRQ